MLQNTERKYHQILLVVLNSASEAACHPSEQISVKKWHVLGTMTGAVGDTIMNKPQSLNLRNKRSRGEIKMHTNNCCTMRLK